MMSESQPESSTPESSPEAAARGGGPSTRIAETPFELSQEPVTPEGAAEVPAAGAAPAYEHLGELPVTYGLPSVYLVAYDPRQLFVYWDVDWTTAGSAVHALHVCRPDGEVETQIDISSDDTGRYVTIERTGGTYYVELGKRGRDGSWQPLAFSGRVAMPPPGLSGETEPKFATLPFHLSFQRLLELVHGAMGHGEDLTSALARLQRGTHPSATTALLNALGSLDGDQLHTLEQLLGGKFHVTSGHDAGVGSETTLWRDRHEVIASGGAFGSESLASGAFGSESLSSGGLAAGFGGGSETFSSFIAGLSSETLSSFGLSSETLAGAGAFGSESLSSLSWQLAGRDVGPDSAGMDSERAEIFLRALGQDLDVLGSLFSAVNSGLSSGFSPGSSDLGSAGWA